MAICSFLMERASYTSIIVIWSVHYLSNSFDRFESGELNDNSVETRNILREFARFSPRGNSPTAAMTMEEMADGFVDMKEISVLLMMKKFCIYVAGLVWKWMMMVEINLWKLI